MVFDIFVSYAWIDDKEWIDQFVTALRIRGLTVFKDDDSVSEWGSQDLMDELMAKLRSSRMLIAVITPRFCNSPHCGAELTAALDCAEALGEPRRVVPVTRKVVPEQVKPRALKRRRLIKSEGRGIGEIVDVVAQVALDIRLSDDRTFGPHRNRPHRRGFQTRRSAGRRSSVVGWSGGRCGTRSPNGRGMRARSRSGGSARWPG